MEDKIGRMLDKLKSDENIEKMKAFDTTVTTHTSRLTQICTGNYDKMEPPVSLAGTVSLTPDSKTVTGTATKFRAATQAGQWLMFDSDTSRMVYKIEVIASDTSLTLSTPYNGTPSAPTAVKYLYRKTKRPSIAEILAMPLETVGQARAFIKEMSALELDLIHLPSDIPSFAGWKVAAYLQEAQNQSKEGWPEVLGVWCRTYCNLLTANMMLCCLADPKTMARRLAEVFVPDKKPVDAQELDDADIEKIAASPITKQYKRNCEDLLLQLQTIELWLRRRWEEEKAQLLTIVQNITKVARERGLYAHLGYRFNSLVLYVAPGNGRSDPLKWGIARAIQHG